RLVFTDQASGEFVQEITASISYSGMDTSHFASGFGSIFRVFSLFRVSPLRLGQFLFVFDEKFGIADLLTSREDHEVFQSKISSNGLRCWLKMGDLLFDQDAHKVAISSVFGDGHCGWLGIVGQGTRPTYRQRFRHFRQDQLFAIPTESRISIGRTLLVV